MARHWDDGIRWHLERIEKPDMSRDALITDFLRDDHLRAAAGTVEDDWIERAWLVTYQRAEKVTRRPLIPQTWALVMDRFPCREIVIPKSPLLAVASIDYVDPDGVLQTLGGSPASFNVQAPSGDNPPKGTIVPLYGETWPSMRTVPDAVTVTFTCGYPLVDNIADVPADITHARLLLLGELYKQRSLSVHAFNQNPAIVQADAIWREYRSY